MVLFAILQVTDQKMTTSELACAYAALILHDDGVDITVSEKNVGMAFI